MFGTPVHILDMGVFVWSERSNGEREKEGRIEKLHFQNY